MKRLEKLFENPFVRYGLLIFSAVLSALNFELFIFPNDFASGGLNGLATMAQYLFGIDLGYLSLLINLPLLAGAFFCLDRRYAVRTLAFVVAFSVANLIFRASDLSPVAFVARDGGDAILAAIAGGVFNGVIYSFSIRLGASTGGVDVIAGFVNRAHPEYDLVWLIFGINFFVAVTSFFVYGMKYQPVILCVVYSFVTGRVSEAILKGARAAAKFEVITETPDALAAELMRTLGHGCTLLRATGMYSHTDRAMLVCVVNRRQVVDFQNIVKKYDRTFAVISTVNGTVGNFRRVK